MASGITLAQTPNANASSGSVASFALAYPSNVTAGNRLVAVLGSPVGGLTSYSVSDSLNGAWTSQASLFAGGGAFAVFDFTNTLGGACTVTMTPSGSAACRLTLFELNGAGAPDVNSSRSAPASTSPSTLQTAGLANSGEFIVCGAATSAGGTTWTAGAGYTRVSPGTSVNWASEYGFSASTAGVFGNFGITNSFAVVIGVVVYQIANPSWSLSALSSAFAEGLMSAAGGDVLTSQAGGTGSSRKRRRALIRLSRDIYRDEMARLEREAQQATRQRVEIEKKLETGSPYEPVAEDILRYIADFERALARAQAREKRISEQLNEIRVSFRLTKTHEETSKRLASLVSIARHREAAAFERLRKVRDRIDEEAAMDFMWFLMLED